MTEITAARAVFLAFFAALITLVYCLPRDYVLRGARDRRWWRDLRLWALVLVLIHAYVYWRF
jgi:hypothetical protein